MAGETGGPEDRYLMFKAVERELKEMKNSITGDAKTSTGLLSFVSKIFK